MKKSYFLSLSAVALAFFAGGWVTPVAGFPEVSSITQAADTGAASFALSPIAAQQVRNAPIPITLTARDSQGATIPDYTGTPVFTAQSPSGGIEVFTPTIGGFVNGVWTGNITIGQYAENVILTATVDGITVTSGTFNVRRGPMHRLSWGQITSPQTMDTPFGVSLRAEDAGGNLVDDFAGTVSLSAVSLSPGAPTGTGTLVSWDLESMYSQSRFQCVYTPAEIGATGPLTALAMNISELPETPWTEFTIRVKHTSRANYDSPHPGWESDGWTLVYRGTLDPGETGWHTFPFIAPFDYDGTSNLMVDFSFNGDGMGGGGAYLASATSDSRKIDYNTYYGTNPLGWSGENQYYYPSNELPNLRFTSYNTLSPIRPATTGTFSGGMWNGVASLPFTADSVKLLASDGAEHAGTSNGFTVTTVKPPIRPGTFTEQFEKQPLENSWKFTGTNSYQTRVSTDYEPHGGTRHLVMDTSDYTNTSTRNEATWTVDLMGLSGVTLKFWAKTGYDGFSPSQPSPPIPFTNGADFNGVAVSADGVRWYEVQSLRTLNENWKQFTVNLDNAIVQYGLAYNSNFRIRFNRYGRDMVHYDGLALDDIEITSKPSPYLMKVTGPAQVGEGGGPTRFAVTLPLAAAADTIISLSSSAPAKATVPGQVTVPAGRLSTSFMVQPVDDSLADGTKTVEITATSPTFSAGALSLMVLDDDQSAPTITVPTTDLVEGTTPIQATVSVATPAAASATYNVTSSNTNEITVPATITIPLGATSVVLPITIVNDNRLDGLQSTTVTVSEPGGGVSRGITFHVADNETLDLALRPTASPAPTSVNEGGAGISFSASLPGSVATSSTLTFSSTAPAKIVPPAAKTIAAGAVSTTVTFTLVDDQISQASEPVTLTVSSPGFTTASYVLTFLDNDPHHFTIAPIASPQVRGAPIPITVTACDPAGGTVEGFLGPVTLGAGGHSVLPASLAPFTKGIHSGTVRINDVADDVVLTVADSQGHTGSSNPFDVGLGTFQKLAWTPISPDRPPASNIPVTLQALDAGGNIDPSVNVPVTVRALATFPATTFGEGANDMFTFIRTYYKNSRSEVLYFPEDIGGKRMLGGIALNVKAGAAGQLLPNFTIRLKTTTRTRLDGWDQDGWTVVHRSTQKLTANGWITLLFDVPFDYNGTENLLVDYSYNGSSTGDQVTWSGDYTDGYGRILFSYTDTDVDPLTWSGNSPWANTFPYLPQTRFFGLQPAPATIPPSPEITAGVWNGVVSFQGNIDRVFLEATDSSGHHAVSDALRIGTPVLVAGASVPFTDGFEAGALSSAWETSTVGSGRIRVLSTNTPHTGTYHVISDNSGFDVRTELTLPLNLTGHTGVTLGFWAKRFGTTDDGPPTAPFTGGADFDGVAMSADGITWYEIQPLRGMTSGAWTQFTVNLDAAAAARGLVYTSDFRIRFNQFGDSSAPYDGMALDDVSVTGNPPNRVTLVLPDSIGETDGFEEGSVNLPIVAATDTVVMLASSSPLALGVPASVIVPAGQTGTTFNITVTDNSSVNGPLVVMVTATTDGMPPTFAEVEVTDDDSGTLALSAPAVITENGPTAQATLTISPAPTGTIDVSFTSSLPGAIQVPATVRIQPGQTSVPVPLKPVDDYKFTGPRTVTLAASLDGWPTATTSLTVNEKENRSFNWSPRASEFALEGSTTSISIISHGIVSEDVTFTLTSSDTTRLILPATATIPAGSQSVTVPITAPENDTVEGTRFVFITASTGGPQTDTRDFAVRDNDAHHFSFDPIQDRQIVGEAFPFSASAYDIEDHLITNYAGTLPLTATGDAGTIGSSPATITFAAGVATGNMTVTTASENVRLQVAPGADHSGTSEAFSVIPAGPASYRWSTIGTQTVGKPFTATITARDAANGLLSNHTGYVSLSSLPGGTGSERTIGSGTATTDSFPLLTAYRTQRTQVIYPAGEVGSATTLSSLSLYITTASGRTPDSWTIRLKPTSLTAYPNPGQWENTGWTTVFSGSQTISQAGWVTFNFSTPFVYTGTNLMVDFSFNIIPFTNEFPSKSIRTFSTGTYRTITSFTPYSDPLTWSGSMPNPNRIFTVPQIKLGYGGLSSPVSPATVLLTNGTWTGSLFMGAATTGTAITARDSNGATGTSNNFGVASSPDGDGDGLPNSWETANNLAIGSKAGDNGAMGDPDGDGVPNLLEYAFNLDPLAASNAGLPFSVTMVNPVDGEDYLELTYRRRIGSAGLNYIIETSGDCVTWSPATSQSEAAAGPLPTGDGVSETVTVRILPKINTTPVKFARLRVAAP